MRNYKYLFTQAHCNSYLHIIRLFSIDLNSPKKARACACVHPITSIPSFYTGIKITCQEFIPAINTHIQFVRYYEYVLCHFKKRKIRITHEHQERQQRQLKSTEQTKPAILLPSSTSYVILTDRENTWNGNWKLYPKFGNFSKTNVQRIIAFVSHTHRVSYTLHLSDTLIQLKGNEATKSIPRFRFYLFMQ